MKSKELEIQYNEAREYIGKIGSPQNHFRDGSVGNLSTLKVDSQIHHQAYTGATNYWKSKYFDTALSEIIQEEFKELAEKALKRMQDKYIKARIQEKEYLLEKLKEIEELEKSQTGESAP